MTIRKLKRQGTLKQSEKCTEGLSPRTLDDYETNFGYLLDFIGGDPFSLQKILRHKDMTMTRRYIQMANANVKDHHEQFSPINSLFKNK